jgi:hypothetical protein
VEADAVFRERVDVGRFHPRPGLWIAAHGAVVLIIRVDEEHVWARGGLGEKGEKQKENGRANHGAETRRSGHFVRKKVLRALAGPPPCSGERAAVLAQESRLDAMSPAL